MAKNGWTKMKVDKINENGQKWMKVYKIDESENMAESGGI